MDTHMPNAVISNAYQNRIHVESRTLFLFHERSLSDVDLDEENTSVILTGLHILSSLSHEDIRIFINNKGGDQQHGFAIYDLIRHSPCRITGTVLGHCHSMASWILQACDWRQASRNSEIMIHDGKPPHNYRKFVQDQDEVARQILLGRIREKHPDYTRRSLMQLLKRDTYLTAHESLELGLLDEILQDNQLKINSSQVFRQNTDE